MKKHVPLTLQANRIRDGQYGSDESYGLAGGFRLIGPSGLLLVMSNGVGDGTGWEHVSVVSNNRPPTWEEMCWVKDIFWDDHEMVIQYHPPKSENVNFHPHCLHLWRCTFASIPMPPSLLVGPRTR